MSRIFALVLLSFSTPALAQATTQLSLPDTAAEVMIFEKAQLVSATGRGKSCDEALSDALGSVDKKVDRLAMRSVVSYVDDARTPVNSTPCEAKGKKFVVRLDAVVAEPGGAEPFMQVSKGRAVEMAITLADRPYVPIQTKDDVTYLNLAGRSERASLAVVEVTPRGEELVVLLDKDTHDEVFPEAKNANSRGVDLFRAFVTKRSAAYHATMAELNELDAAALEVSASRWGGEPEPIAEMWRFELDSEALASFVAGEVTGQALLDASRVFRGSERIELSIAYAD